MRWARLAVAMGVALLVLSFCFAIDTPTSATVDGRSHACTDVLDPASLVSGQPTDRAAVPLDQTPTERLLAVRVDAACAPVERMARWATWAAAMLGGLALLTGWTALREREHDAQVTIRRGPPDRLTPAGPPPAGPRRPSAG